MATATPQRGKDSSFIPMLVDALNKRGIASICEACKRNDWTIVDEPVKVVLSSPSGTLRVPAAGIVAGILICNYCGNIRIHALGPLGLSEE